jgi:hypothetical protein
MRSEESKFMRVRKSRPTKTWRRREGARATPYAKEVELLPVDEQANSEMPTSLKWESTTEAIRSLVEQVGFFVSSLR